VPRLGLPRARAALLTAAHAIVAGPAAAHAALAQSAPNDPDYAAAEGRCATVSVNDEQHYLYSREPTCTPFARDPDGASGMSVDTAWREVTTGLPDVTIAYVEGGINWHEPGARDIVDQVFLNAGELPPPTTPVADGRVNVRDYADTPDANGNGYVDPEDLIVRFSDGRDDDGNGYVDDISGWDFYDHQNDPATVESPYDHANDQMRQAAGEADNGLLGVGVCPGCAIVPIKAGAEALDRTDDLAQAWLYATDIGAKVIVSVTADLGYSTFMRQAVDHAWRHGLLLAEASNDFDSTDHQGGMFWPHVLPGNGLVSNTQGLSLAALNPFTTTFTARSGQTSWGTHNMFSVATQGGSTSTSTPTIGGVGALVLSAGEVAAQRGRIAEPLTGAEAVQVLRATVSDIDGPTNWPSKPGWDLQFGYGRPNVARAVRAVMAGDIPPVGWIDSPDWYALVDPTRTHELEVTGHVEARRSPRYRYRLQVAPGAEPTEGQFVTVGSGAGTAPRDGRLGALDLDRLPSSFWSAPYRLSQTKTLETSEQYTVTLRLQVVDAHGRVGEERRTIAVHHDPSWRDGLGGRGPIHIGPGGEAQPQLADLQGTGHQAAIFGDDDGVVHAIDMTDGQELPGWPATTRPVDVVRGHDGIDPRHEQVLANAAVGDLDGDGRLSVVVTSAAGRVYVFDAHGRLRAGWPKTLDTGVSPPPIPRPADPYTRLPTTGATAPPVLADLDGDHRLDIVQAGWDGRLHVFGAGGAEKAGWPQEVTVPASLPPEGGRVRVQDHKLDTPPAVADLDGDGVPELVIRSQYQDVHGAGIQPLSQMYVHAFHADGSTVAGWPVRLGGLLAYYGSAQEFVTEGVHTPAGADVDGDGRDEIAVEPIFSPTVLLDGSGRVLRLLGNAGGGQLGFDLPVGFATAGAFGRIDGTLSYAAPGSGGLSIAGALLLTGSGLPINNALRLSDAATGASTAGYPGKTQGLDFLGGVTIADVNGDGRPEVLEGGDTSTLHAFGPNAGQVDGFPKFTGGWMVYAPSVADVDGDGHNDVVGITREGYLFAWRTPGLAASNEWWSFRHDERNTSRYGAGTRPPAVHVGG
jgi:hypothetical protein